MTLPEESPADTDSFVAENLDRYADTQGVLPERL